MGILDDYMSGSTAPSAQQAASRSVINQFMNAPEEVPTTLRRDVRPPISGVSREASEAINIQPTQKGGANPRPGIETVPLKAGIAAYEEGKAGILEAGSGLGETLSGKPASGLGKVGMGLLRVVGSPFEGASSIAGDITGSKEIAGKTGLVAGFVPVGGGARAVVSRIPGVDILSNVPVVRRLAPTAASKNKALRELVDQITSEGRDPQALVDTISAMKADSRIAPVDTSPNVLNKAQGLFVEGSPAAKEHLFSASKGRMANLPEDVEKAYDELGGVPVNALQKLNDLAAAAKKAGSDIINPALVNAKPVDISPVIDHIDTILKPGIMKHVTGETTLPFNEVKQKLSNLKSMIANDKERLTDPQALHNFQSALRREAETRLASADGGERQLGRALMAVRNRVVNAINEASPKIKIIENGIEKEVGQYKHGLNIFREEKDVGNAFREGYQSSAKGMEKDPSFTKQWFDSLNDYEKEAAREGKRLSISHKMGQSNNPSLAGTNAARSDFNKQELEIFFGKEGTEKTLRDLENTRSIKNTDQKIIEGSQTAMRMSGQASNKLPVQKTPLEMAPPYAAEAIGAITTGMPGIGVTTYEGLKYVGKAVHMIQTKLAKERQLHFAEMALPVEGPKRDQLIKELEAFIPGPKQSLVSRVASRLPIAP